MSMPILFLDIDGVLNDHKSDPLAESTTILPRCVEQLNRILDTTKCRVVLVSAWRYMHHGGAMTLAAMEYLFRTHWIHVKDGVLIDVTRRDWEPYEMRATERGRQVREWLSRHDHGGVGAFVALDDMDLGYTHYNIPFVDTDGKVGLTEVEADKVIEILMRPAYLAEFEAWKSGQNGSASARGEESGLNSLEAKLE